MIVKASELLKRDLKPFLLGVLYSRIMSEPKTEKIPDRFFVYSSFKTSKVVWDSSFAFLEYASKLVIQYNDLSGYKNWEIHSANDKQIELRFYIQNDLGIDSTNFYNLIYKKLLQCDWVHYDELNKDKKNFISGYMEPRGSVDTSLKMIAQDYFYNNNYELKRVQLLTDMMNLPISYLNFNPRQMQPDYVTGKRKRNTQFRIHLFYYANIIGFVNEYKAKIFETAYKPGKATEEEGKIFFPVDAPKVTTNVNFVKYINFFSNNIYKKKLTEDKIEELRKQIGFDSSKQTSKSRNRSLREIFDSVSEDKCALCSTTTTFEKTNGKQYFEIHHMISYSNGHVYDNIANFVKLCPTCHDSLKKNNSPKDEQIKSIVKILHNKPEVFEYTSSTLGIEDIFELADKIWEMLG
jgi:5-methylcytosine-specific restriction protein A